MTDRKKLPPKARVKIASVERRENWLGASGSDRDDEVAREFLWNVLSIGSFLEDIRRIWANALSVSGPQWLILMAINELDVENGASVGEVAEKIHVRGTFVTAQTKSLERSGFLIRKTSSEDARIVLMSLTQEARSKIAKLSARRKMLNDLIFADLNDRSLRDITENLTLIRNRVEKAALHLGIES